MNRSHHIQNSGTLVWIEIHQTPALIMTLDFLKNDVEATC